MWSVRTNVLLKQGLERQVLHISDSIGFPLTLEGECDAQRFVPEIP